MCSFDNIDHDLLMRAVKKHAQDPWVVLYIGFCRKFSFEVICSMISPYDPQ